MQNGGLNRGDEMSTLTLTCPTRRLSREFNIVDSELTITLLNGSNHKETCTIEGVELLPRKLALDGNNYEEVVRWLRKLGKD